MVEANLGTEACRVQASPHVAWVPDSGTEALTHVGYGFCLLASKRLPRLKFWSRFCDANFVCSLGGCGVARANSVVAPLPVRFCGLPVTGGSHGAGGHYKCRGRSILQEVQMAAHTYAHTHTHIYIYVICFTYIYIYISINDMGVTLHVPSDVDPVVPYV